MPDEMKNKMEKSERVIPRRVTIETIFGCNASCNMCVIDQPTPRKKGLMDMDLFKGIIDSLLPYRGNIEMMDLFCLGEPLLDKHLFDRIRYVKKAGFRNLGISTNANLLNEEKQEQLLESGIDNVIISIDAAQEDTFKKIRRKLDFQKVVANTESIIKKRDGGGFKTRFVIRFIRQRLNEFEWEPFKAKWVNEIDAAKGDFVTVFNMHSWGGELDGSAQGIGEIHRTPEIERMACPDIFNILYILADGSIPLCNEDWLLPTYNFGNVKGVDPVDVWNSVKFRAIRDLHTSGNKNKMDKCKDCTVHYSMKEKEIATA